MRKYKAGIFMKQTTQRYSDKYIAVDIDKLSAMLSCGHSTAKKIGTQAEAKIVIGRRVLYLVDKIQKYLDLMAE